ncbi:MAG: molybdopterin-guanine dinucleotide biosynthesis protein [Clostridiales bacterium]|nr:molybdopterin-guanine dinucleotide biosynthesis protein [Clostridiales bacterium]
MKIIKVQGISKTGKTTTVEAIIKELRRRGYTVGSIKEIHFEDFTMEKDGSNTDIHKKAGACPVTARGLTETDVMFEGAVDIEKILDMYDQDYVVIEGKCEANCPDIITGRTEEELAAQKGKLTIAASGVISNRISSYEDLPVINALENIEKLVSLIEEKTPERMPNYSADCCTACGTDCCGLTERIIKGTESISRCILKGESVQVFLDGEELSMVPFVKSMVKSVSTSVIKELDGYRDNCEIVIKIKQ